jgi:hypothetical protein
MKSIYNKLGGNNNPSGNIPAGNIPAGNNIQDQGIRFLSNRANRSLGESGNHQDKNTVPRLLSSNGNKKTVIEGFDNGPVNEINEREINQLHDMDVEFQRELQTYNQIKKQILDNTRGYLETSYGSNTNHGKNVQIGNKKGYITDAGLFKEYNSEYIGNNTSGKNYCPANWSSAPKINNHFPKDFSNQLFESIPGPKPIINGLPMKTGQACGNEGKNVFVSQLTPNNKTYIGIYNDVAGSDMKIQDDLGHTSIEQCHSRAALKNADYFAMSDYDGKTATCYIGNDKFPVENSGISSVVSNIKKITTNKPDDGHPPYLYMGYDGRLHAYSGDTQLWSSTNTQVSGCDPIGGGHLYVGPDSGASATYGQNCSEWTVKPNFEATGLGGTDPLPGNLHHNQLKGNKSLKKK